MARAVYVGAQCIITWSAHGALGPSVGRRVKALFRHETTHSKLGVMWHVEASDSRVLVSEHGGVGNEVDVPQDWLHVIEPDQDLTTTETKEVIAA